MHGDIEWPLNASRGFFSIIWASCLISLVWLIISDWHCRLADREDIQPVKKYRTSNPKRFFLGEVWVPGIICRKIAQLCIKTKVVLLFNIADWWCFLWCVTGFVTAFPFRQFVFLLLRFVVDAFVSLILWPRAACRVVRIDSLRFLARCR